MSEAATDQERDVSLEVAEAPKAAGGPGEELDDEAEWYLESLMKEAVKDRIHGPTNPGSVSAEEMLRGIGIDLGPMFDDDDFEGCYDNCGGGYY